MFRAGNIPMLSDEWFMADQVVATFAALQSETPFPSYVRWRPTPGF